MTPGSFVQAQEHSITDIVIDDIAMGAVVTRPGMPENTRPDVTVLRAHSLRDPRLSADHAAPYFSAKDLSSEQPGAPFELATIRAAIEAGKRILEVTVVEWTEADLAAEFVGAAYRQRSNSEPISFRGLRQALGRLVNQNIDDKNPLSNTVEEHRGTNINLARLYKPYRFILRGSATTEHSEALPEPQ